MFLNLKNELARRNRSNWRIRISTALGLISTVESSEGHDGVG